MTQQPTAITASLLHILGAYLYDTLICAGILLAATFILMPFTHAQAISANQLWFQLYLFASIYLFFNGFWTHGGQTLGMKAWGIKIISNHGKALTWKQSNIRFFMAMPSICCFGLGLFWMLFDKQSRSWQDIVSDSRIIYLNR